MTLTAGKYLQLFKKAGQDWLDDHAPRLGAALAFYTLFSLAPLLTMVISITSLWFTENANQQIFEQLGSMIGQENAKSVQEMLVQPGKEKSGIFTTVAAAVMLVFGATAVFVQLQDALNSIWEVKPKPGQGIKGFIRHRLLSFAAVLGIGFLLLVSLVLTAAIAAVGNYFSQWLGQAEWLWHAINLVVSFAVVTVLFAFMFKYLPDAKIEWRDVWVGAVVTSLLFSLGKFALGLYLGKSSLVSTYSVAGGLIVLLLWVYYSSQILFFGAELTQAYANHFGRGVLPSAHAEWDAEKACKAESASNYREAKQTPNARFPQPMASPGFALGSAPGFQSSSGNKRLTLKKMGPWVVLALLFLPVKKWVLAGGRKSSTFRL